MGGKQSTHGHHGRSHAAAAESKPAQEETGTSSGGAPAAAAAAVVAKPEVEQLQKVDVLIGASNACSKDTALARALKDALESASISVCIVGDTDEDTKAAGKLLVDSKCFVYVASKEAAAYNAGQDLISLAYISNKIILVAAEAPKKELMGGFVIGMKMTLNQLQWIIFYPNNPTSQQVEGFVEKIKETTSASGDAPPTESIEMSVVIKKRGGRLNTKLRQRSTQQDMGVDLPEDTGTFWDRNFQSEDEVPWFKFQQCFLQDYQSQLENLLDEENIPWLLKLLKNDLFDGAEKVTKVQFMEVRGESDEKNAFWRAISQIAVEKFNMKEVFNMNSTVRLSAIEKLSAFQNPAVVEALMELLEDTDPNVRAVAAISLGRTGCKEERVVDKLIDLLKDGDRIVRQSACLSLGSIKAVKGIPYIGNIWRNDFISVVRNAARTALENMKIPEAQEVLSVTKILEEEIAALEGNQAAV